MRLEFHASDVRYHQGMPESGPSHFTTCCCTPVRPHYLIPPSSYPPASDDGYGFAVDIEPRQAVERKVGVVGAGGRPVHLPVERHQQGDGVLRYCVRAARAVVVVAVVIVCRRKRRTRYFPQARQERRRQGVSLFGKGDNAGRHRCQILRA